MILVDVYVPSTDQEYNFQLDENVSVQAVVEEIAELVAQKEKTILTGSAGQLCLCSRDLQALLPANATLAKCKIRNGAKLILV